MPESNTKRIFAEVSIETRDQFLAKARLEGTTGKALIKTCELAILRDMRIQIDTLVHMEAQYRRDIVRRQQDGESVEPGALTPPQTLTPQAHKIDMHTHVCDPNGVHVEDSQT